jgi:hypothetical protein
MTTQTAEETKARVALMELELRESLLARALKPRSSAKPFYVYAVIAVALGILPAVFPKNFGAYDNLWPLTLLIVGLVFAEGKRIDDRIDALVKLLDLERRTPREPVARPEQERRRNA